MSTPVWQSLIINSFHSSKVVARLQLFSQISNGENTTKLGVNVLKQKNNENYRETSTDRDGDHVMLHAEGTCRTVPILPHSSRPLWGQKDVNPFKFWVRHQGSDEGWEIFRGETVSRCRLLLSLSATDVHQLQAWGSCENTSSSWNPHSESFEWL